MTNTAHAINCWTCRHKAALAAYNSADRYAATVIGKMTFAILNGDVAHADATALVLAADAIATRAYDNAIRAGVGADTLDAMSR